jgi:hypothetical protein
MTRHQIKQESVGKNGTNLKKNEDTKENVTNKKKDEPPVKKIVTDGKKFAASAYDLNTHTHKLWEATKRMRWNGASDLRAKTL